MEELLKAFERQLDDESLITEDYLFDIRCSTTNKGKYYNGDEFVVGEHLLFAILENEEKTVREMISLTKKHFKNFDLVRSFDKSSIPKIKNKK